MCDEVGGGQEKLKLRLEIDLNFQSQNWSKFQEKKGLGAPPKKREPPGDAAQILCRFRPKLLPVFEAKLMPPKLLSAPSAKPLDSQETQNLM